MRPDGLANHALFHEDCRVAGMHFEIGYIPGDNAACGRNRAFAQNDTGRKQTFRARPSAVIELNGGNDQSEGWIAPIVIPGAQIDPLRETHVVAEAYGGEIVDPAVFSDPAIVAYNEAPWILHIDPRLDDDACADLRTKEPQDKYLHRRGRQQ